MLRDNNRRDTKGPQATVYLSKLNTRCTNEWNRSHYQSQGTVHTGFRNNSRKGDDDDGIMSSFMATIKTT